MLAAQDSDRPRGTPNTGMTITDKSKICGKDECEMAWSYAAVQNN